VEIVNFIVVQANLPGHHDWFYTLSATLIYITITPSLWWLFFAYPTDLVTMLTMAYEQEVLGTIIGLGAILNLVAFFGFIRLRHDLRARGVLIATFLSAFVTLVLKFL